MTQLTLEAVQVSLEHTYHSGNAILSYVHGDAMVIAILSFMLVVSVAVDLFYTYSLEIEGPAKTWAIRRAMLACGVALLLGWLADACQAPKSLSEDIQVLADAEAAWKGWPVTRREYSVAEVLDLRTSVEEMLCDEVALKALFNVSSDTMANPATFSSLNGRRLLTDPIAFLTPKCQRKSAHD